MESSCGWSRSSWEKSQKPAQPASQSQVHQSASFSNAAQQHSQQPQQQQYQQGGGGGFMGGAQQGGGQQMRQQQAAQRQPTATGYSQQQPRAQMQQQPQQPQQAQFYVQVPQLQQVYDAGQPQMQTVFYPQSLMAQQPLQQQQPALLQQPMFAGSGPNDARMLDQFTKMSQMKQYTEMGQRSYRLRKLAELNSIASEFSSSFFVFETFAGVDTRVIAQQLKLSPDEVHSRSSS
jgi:hypothetical protein